MSEEKSKIEKKNSPKSLTLLESCMEQLALKVSALPEDILNQLFEVVMIKIKKDMKKKMRREIISEMKDNLILSIITEINFYRNPRMYTDTNPHMSIETDINSLGSYIGRRIYQKYIARHPAIFRGDIGEDDEDDDIFPEAFNKANW